MDGQIEDNTRFRVEFGTFDTPFVGTPLTALVCRGGLVDLVSHC
jgi:hypothetical protein